MTHRWSSCASIDHTPLVFVCRYNHEIDCVKVQGLDHCYDCAAEASICREFLVAHRGANPHSPKTMDLVAEMIEKIGKTVAPKGGKVL